MTNPVVERIETMRCVLFSSPKYALFFGWLLLQFYFHFGGIPLAEMCLRSKTSECRTFHHRRCWCFWRYIIFLAPCVRIVCFYRAPSSCYFSTMRVKRERMRVVVVVRVCVCVCRTWCSAHFFAHQKQSLLFTIFAYRVPTPWREIQTCAMYIVQPKTLNNMYGVHNRG